MTLTIRAAAIVVAAMALLTTVLAQESTGTPPTHAAPTPGEVDAQIAKMQALMTAMNEQMRRLQQTTDPTERQKLMEQHWATMQSAMTQMQSAWGGDMPGHGMMGPMKSWGDFSKMTPEQRAQHQYMMERWMPMQQMMMGQMMQHQRMTMPSPDPTPSP